MKRFKKVLVGFSVAVLGVVLLMPYAHALPILEISSGGTTITVADGDGSDGAGADGVVSWSGTIANFIISFTVGASKPILGETDAPSMHLTSLQISGPATGTITVKFTDTDFTLPLSSGLDSFLSVIGGSTTQSVDSFTTYFDDTNTAFGTGTQLASLGPFVGSSGNPLAFAGSLGSSILPLTSPYSLTMIAKITHNNAWQATSIDSHIIANPEPSTVLLFGSGLIALGAWRWRKSHS